MYPSNNKTALNEGTELQQEFAKAKNGDKSAEEILFQFLRVRFTIIAKNRIWNDNYEDIVHDACTTVIEKYKDLPQDIEFEAWAYKVLRNKIGNYIRATNLRNKTIKFVGDIETQFPACENPEYRSVLIRCLEKLSKAYPKYIRVLNMVNYGYTSEEICKELEISKSNLYVILHRCRRLLSECVFGKRMK